MDPITLKLRPEEAELLRDALKVAIDALEHSDRDAALCAPVGADDCSVLIYKLDIAKEAS